MNIKLQDFKDHIDSAIVLGDIKKDTEYRLFYNYPRISESDITVDNDICTLNGIVLDTYYIFKSEHKLIKLLAFENKDYLKNWYLKEV
jgi:hypothetical protein